MHESAPAWLEAVRAEAGATERLTITVAPDGLTRCAIVDPFARRTLPRVLYALALLIAAAGGVGVWQEWPLTGWTVVALAPLVVLVGLTVRSRSVVRLTLGGSAALQRGGKRAVVPRPRARLTLAPPEGGSSRHALTLDLPRTPLALPVILAPHEAERLERVIDAWLPE